MIYICDMYYIIYNVWGGKYFIDYVLPINITKSHGHFSSILSDLNTFRPASYFIKLDAPYFIYVSR